MVGVEWCGMVDVQTETIDGARVWYVPAEPHCRDTRHRNRMCFLQPYQQLNELHLIMLLQKLSTVGYICSCDFKLVIS
jgi:hypothetical protein